MEEVCLHGIWFATTTTVAYDTTKNMTIFQLFHLSRLLNRISTYQPKQVSNANKFTVHSLRDKTANFYCWADKVQFLYAFGERWVMQCRFLPFMSLSIYSLFHIVLLLLLLLLLLFNSRIHVVKKFFQVFRLKPKRPYEIIFADKSSDGRTHNSFQLWNCPVVFDFL